MSRQKEAFRGTNMGLPRRKSYRNPGRGHQHRIRRLKCLTSHRTPSLSHFLFSIKKVALPRSVLPGSVLVAASLVLASMMTKRAEMAPDVLMINCSALAQSDGIRKSLDTAFATVTVNQGFARKTKRVSDIRSHYPLDGPMASSVWNVFDVIPRPYTDGSLAIPVLERHPYTTQTFIPLGCSPASIEYMVVIAEDLNGVPNPVTLKAFLCRGGQAVTYGPNQWHAPMIALKRSMVFLVTNAENGTSDDCEEHFFQKEDQPRVLLNHIDLEADLVVIAKAKL